MLYVRADGNSKIGMGHIMRCISIAKEVINKGYEVKFLLASNEPEDVLKDANIPYHILNTDYRNMDEELNMLAELLCENDKILVDSYYVTKEYLTYLKKTWSVFYIDDVHSFEYPVDMIINGNIYGDREEYVVKKVLGGCKYSPLRGEFQKIEKQCKAERILLTTGSSDPYGLTEKITKSLLSDEILKTQKMDIICGKYNESYVTLKALENKFPNIKVHQNVSNMWEYMQNAMLAISAGGTTMTELGCMGVPIVSFSFVDNQDRIVKTFAEDGYAHYGGFWMIEGEKLIDNICKAAKQLVLDEKLRKEYSCKLMKLIDGKGCERIAEAIIGFEKDS